MLPVTFDLYKVAYCIHVCFSYCLCQALSSDPSVDHFEFMIFTVGPKMAPRWPPTRTRCAINTSSFTDFAMNKTLAIPVFSFPLFQVATVLFLRVERKVHPSRFDQWTNFRCLVVMSRYRVHVWFACYFGQALSVLIILRSWFVLRDSRLCQFGHGVW